VLITSNTSSSCFDSSYFSGSFIILLKIISASTSQGKLVLETK